MVDQEIRKMRKGLWSPEEDEKLRRCIAMYKKGSWSDIAKRSGLQRCGKSCRRRWMNHLRPGLKRGRFSPLEIKLVAELHRTLGNRWSEIAGHLAGRTDNDVKNLWNTQIKRRINKLPLQQSLTFNNIHHLHKPPTFMNQTGDDTNKLIMLQRHNDDTTGIALQDMALSSTHPPDWAAPMIDTSVAHNNCLHNVLDAMKELQAINSNYSIDDAQHKEGSKGILLPPAPLENMVTATLNDGYCSYHGPVNNPWELSSQATPQCITEEAEIICSSFAMPKEYLLEDWFLPLLSDDVLTSSYVGDGPMFMPLF